MNEKPIPEAERREPEQGGQKLESPGEVDQAT